MKKHNLKDQLDQYLNQQYYPMHMPGHKRRVAVVPECVLRYDLTEVSGTDDLHHASGILKDAMARTSALHGADRSWYLINGSTCGNLAGVSAIVRGTAIVRCSMRSSFGMRTRTGSGHRWIR